MKYPKPSEWPELIAEYRASGLQAKEFAAKHDLSMSTLNYWLYKNSKRSQSTQNRLQRFLPIQVVGSAAPKARDGVVEAALRSGLVVRFAVGTDPRYLAELFAAVG